MQNRLQDSAATRGGATTLLEIGASTGTSACRAQSLINSRS
jgi:hypothetical protein